MFDKDALYDDFICHIANIESFASSFQFTIQKNADCPSNNNLARNKQGTQTATTDHW